MRTNEDILKREPEHSYWLDKLHSELMTESRTTKQEVKIHDLLDCPGRWKGFHVSNDYP
jgi:hypothetical protein